MIIGSSGNIERHYEIQSSYEEAENAEQFVEKAKFKFEEMQKFDRLCRTVGFTSKETVSQLKKMLNNEYFKNEEQLIQLKRLYIASGHWH